MYGFFFGLRKAAILKKKSRFTSLFYRIGNGSKANIKKHRKLCEKRLVWESTCVGAGRHAPL